MGGLKTAWVWVGMAMLAVGCGNDPYPRGEVSKPVLLSGFGDVTSFDPATSFNADDGVLMDCVYPTFYRYNIYKRSPSVLELEAGAKPPTMKRLPDGREDWSYTFRKDLVFADDPCFPGGKGRIATAADVVYSFKRMADPDCGCPVHDYVADKIEGFQQFGAGFKTKGKSHYADPLPGVFADPRDPFTLHIVLVKHYPELSYIMGMHFTTPMAHEVVERYGDGLTLYHMVGCGAYKMAEHLPGEKLVLVRNSNAHFEEFPQPPPGVPADVSRDAGRPLPITDKVVFTHFREALTWYNLFQQGYLDYISAVYSTVQNMPAATTLTPEMRARGVKLRECVMPFSDWLAFNMLDPVFGGYTPQRRKLRQAISLAIDSDAYSDVICQGLAKPAQFMIPPGIEGYDPKYKNPYRQYDPSLMRAKQLLAEAGYPKGIDPKTRQPLVLKFDTFADTPALRQMERLLVQQIQALGVRVEPREGDYATYTERMKSGNFQFAFDNWIADYPDAENFLLQYVKSNWEPGPNDSMYENPKIEELYKKIARMDSGPERVKLIREARDIIVEDCPKIYLAYQSEHELIQPWSTGQYFPAVGNELVKYAGVDPHLRTELESQWNRSNLWPLPLFAGFFVLGVAPAAAAIRQRRNRKVRREKRP